MPVAWSTLPEHRGNMDAPCRSARRRRTPGLPGVGPAGRIGVSGVEGWPAAALAGVAAFCVSAGCTGWIVHRAPGWLVDHPNERSLHARPVSRGGGAAIAAGAAAGLGVAALAGPPTPTLGWVLAGAAMIAAVSFADDLRGMPPALRLVVHFAAAGCVLLAGLGCDRIALPGAALELGPGWGAAFTVLFVVWSVNLFNFMDGIDGYAAGMAAIGFPTLALLSGGAEPGAVGAACLAVGAAAAGFLPFNAPPARIFMGDLGATLLGFLCAAAALATERAAAVPLWASVLVFSPVIADATVTLARRTLAGKRPWRAHREHFSQRLVRLGWGHRTTVLRGWALMTACAVSAVLALEARPALQAGVLGAWTAVYVLLMLGVARLERRAAGRAAD